MNRRLKCENDTCITCKLVAVVVKSCRSLLTELGILCLTDLTVWFHHTDPIWAERIAKGRSIFVFQLAESLEVSGMTLSLGRFTAGSRPVYWR